MNKRRCHVLNWIEFNWITLFHVGKKVHVASLHHITKHMSKNDSKWKWKWFNNSLSDSTTHFLAFTLNFWKKLHPHIPTNQSLCIMLHHHPQIDDYLKSSLELSSENFFIEIFLSIMTFFCGVYGYDLWI